MTARTVGEERRKVEARKCGGGGDGSCDHYWDHRLSGVLKWADERRGVSPTPPRAYTDRTDRRQRSAPVVTEEMIEAGCIAYGFGNAPANERFTNVYTAMRALEQPDRRQHTRRIADRQGGARFG